MLGEVIDKIYARRLSCAIRALSALEIFEFLCASAVK